MRLDEWQRWLDSQFLDSEEPAAIPVEWTVEQEYSHEPPPTPDYTTQVGNVEEPCATEDHQSQHVRNGVAVQADTSPDSHSYSSDAPEPVSLAPPQSFAVGEPRNEPPTTWVAERSDDEEDTGVPTIEQYLPFLRARKETSEAAPAAEPEPEIVAVGSVEAVPAPVQSRHTESSIEKAPAAIEEGKPDIPGEPQDEAPTHARRMSPQSHRPRKGRHVRSDQGAGAVSAQDFWSLNPRGIQPLIAMTSDEVAQHSYKRGFKESRIELLQRLLDPTLSLEETARLLNVCPTTVRRYTNRGMLRHLRTGGDQRRFKLSDVLSFLESQSTTSPPQER